MFLCIPVDKFVEPAHRTVGGLVLIQERETGRLEFFEEILPRNRVQRLILWAESSLSRPGSSFFPVPSTCDGRPPRDSAHLRMVL
jgi:hypothetical protein